MPVSRDSRGVALIILNLDSRCRRKVSFTPSHSTSGNKSPGDVLNRRLDGPQTRFGENANLLLLAGIESRFLERQPQSLVTIPGTLSQLGKRIA